eukprot:gnl/TRDRNA2_/TRDRNA2_182049_c0_seq1.p2 gnl/TRDRNA2_/TRDRNA2_182049_c0~~gnl/TRDRNA2_/TRDRNA2_182049_c0_seq1.p2  ORF type:complete len:159 (-),score=34.79 gnl/TRDRNA2_/TRDRNA2_182049_c0_seq1:183-659(-)
MEPTTPPPRKSRAKPSTPSTAPRPTRLTKEESGALERSTADVDSKNRIQAVAVNADVNKDDAATNEELLILSAGGDGQPIEFLWKGDVYRVADEKAFKEIAISGRRDVASLRRAQQASRKLEPATPQEAVTDTWAVHEEPFSGYSSISEEMPHLADAQ